MIVDHTAAQPNAQRNRPEYRHGNQNGYRHKPPSRERCITWLAELAASPAPHCFNLQSRFHSPENTPHFESLIPLYAKSIRAEKGLESGV
jgi:hypothetical protein